MSVETGSITAGCAVLELGLFLRWKDNNLHMIPALALSKLYSNTLVATLNSRNPQYRNSSRPGVNGEIETGGLHFKGVTTIGSRGMTAPGVRSHSTSVPAVFSVFLFL
jgi:hypothetical protein